MERRCPRAQATEPHHRERAEMGQKASDPIRRRPTHKGCTVTHHCSRAGGEDPLTPQQGQTPAGPGLGAKPAGPGDGSGAQRGI